MFIVLPLLHDVDFALSWVVDEGDMPATIALLEASVQVKSYTVKNYKGDPVNDIGNYFGIEDIKKG